MSKSGQVGGCSRLWLPPDNRDDEAGKHGEGLRAHDEPIPDRRGISVKNLRRRPPVQKISIPQRDLPFDQAIPYPAAAIVAQIDRDNASDDFIKKKPHPKIRSSRTASTKGVVRRPSQPG